jgi:aspartyl-tRNA(Asn)/glutamyl-tRNA(Gln) amidotransferase subunit A
MTDHDLKRLTVAEALRVIRNGALSPIELTDAVLQRIAQLNGSTNAFITVTESMALQQARSSQRQGKLAGIPIAVKDLFDVQGIRTTAGTRVYADRTAADDADVVRKLKESGAVIVGKTNLHEFAFGTTNINAHYGTVRNPWDARRITGGSSGGSAAAVALSMALAALGTDTGGSIRIPAALCGVVGFKPTYGLVSTEGVIPLSQSLDHCGPLTRTVEDAALVLDAITDSAESFMPRKDSHVENLRIGIPAGHFVERVNPEVLAAFQAAIQTLEQLGMRAVVVDFRSASLQLDAFSRVAGYEAYAYHQPLLEQYSELYGGDVLKRLELGKEVSINAYREGLELRDRMRTEFTRALSTVDVMATPTTPVAATPIDQTMLSWSDGEEPVASALARFTRPFNLVGAPAVSIPCGFDSAGMPIGLQIAGRAHDDRTVLEVAAAYERSTEWTQRSAPL